MLDMLFLGIIKHTVTPKKVFGHLSQTQWIIPLNTKYQAMLNLQTNDARPFLRTNSAFLTHFCNYSQPNGVKVIKSMYEVSSSCKCPSRVTTQTHSWKSSFQKGVFAVMPQRNHFGFSKKTIWTQFVIQVVHLLCCTFFFMVLPENVPSFK